MGFYELRDRDESSAEMAPLALNLKVNKKEPNRTATKNVAEVSLKRNQMEK